MASSIPTGAASVTLMGTQESTKDTSADVYYAAGQLEFSSIPDTGSVISITDEQTGQTFYFEFTKNPAGVGTTNGIQHIAVDISTGIISTTDLANKFVNVIQSVMPGASRFTANANRIEIEQSIGGGALAIDASRTLSCIQSAVNPDESGVPTGIFRVEAIDDEIKNTATISFVETDPAQYLNKTFMVGGITYTFVNTAPNPADSTKINISEALEGGVVNPTELASLVVNAIKANISEPERVSVSGTSVQFIPTSTGSDIELDFTNNGAVTGLGGLIKGTGRNGTAATFVDLTKSAITLKNSFNVNNTEIVSGAIVPAVKFNSDGTPQNFYVNSMSVIWANGAENMNGDYGEGTTIALQMGNIGTNDGLTSLSGDFTTNYITQDGAKFGSYAGVSVDENGVVTALYDNGETRPIAILPLATFSNPNGMTAISGNAWMETDYSGQALLKQPNTHGAGTIESNSLEQSTVDLATEFSNMIVTQRAYSASTKIITTADEILDELTRMV